VVSGRGRGRTRVAVSGRHERRKKWSARRPLVLSLTAVPSTPPAERTREERVLVQAVLVDVLWPADGLRDGDEEVARLLVQRRRGCSGPRGRWGGRVRTQLLAAAQSVNVAGTLLRRRLPRPHITKSGSLDSTSARGAPSRKMAPVGVTQNGRRSWSGLSGSEEKSTADAPAYSIVGWRERSKSAAVSASMSSRASAARRRSRARRAAVMDMRVSGAARDAKDHVKERKRYDDPSEGSRWTKPGVAMRQVVAQLKARAPAAWKQS
jgi:hypothetical protein